MMQKVKRSAVHAQPEIDMQQFAACMLWNSTLLVVPFVAFFLAFFPSPPI